MFTIIKKNSTNNHLPRRQMGAGLIEVMVSLSILAIGLLGVLSLQANGLNSNQRAVFITEAQIIAQDMADRIMAFGSIDSDTAAIAAGNAGNAVVTGSYGNGTLNLSKGGTVSSAVCSTGTPCATPAAILAYDGNEWLRALNDSSLPRASTDVSWLAATRIYTIEVRWDQERTGGTGNVTSCNPDNCFTMEVKL